MGLYHAISGGTPPNQPPFLAYGVVTSLDDPDKLGRVEVKLPQWGEEGAVLGFLRVLTPMSGAEWGVFFLPEVGDEVLVAFCGGDIHDPCVLGSFYNEKHRQPVPLEGGKNDLRLIKTRGGHALSFTDKDGEERVELTSGKGLRILLDDKEEQVVLSGPDGKNQVVVDAKNGEITLTAEKKLVLKADKSTLTLAGASTLDSGGAVELKGQDVKLDAKNGASVSAKAKVEVKASGQLDLEAGGPASLKGATLKLN